MRQFYAEILVNIYDGQGKIISLNMDRGSVEDIVLLLVFVCITEVNHKNLKISALLESGIWPLPTALTQIMCQMSV